MRIIKFRIWNYKSIVDSGDCYPTSTITILAGKNEAGKSSILEALNDFNFDRVISEKSIPIGAVDVTPKISIWFEVDRKDIIAILKEIDLSLTDEIPEKTELCLSKDYPKSYTLTGPFVESQGLLEKRDILSAVKAAYEDINLLKINQVGKSIGHPLPSFTEDDLPNLLSKFESYNSIVAANLNSWPLPERNILTEGILTLIELLKEAATPSLATRFKNELLYYFPTFILFSSFDDVFPNTIPLNELTTNKWIGDLKCISDINVDTIIGQNARAKITHRTHINTYLNTDFKQFWTQDVSSLVIDWDNEKLSFWIEENGQYYEPEIRSQGRRWHLAFYIRVSARAKEDFRNVILIDEPGLYLHANAQRDILKNLEMAGTSAQVIFSTHSPYLIEEDKLDRIRLVSKTDERGTVVENKIHKVSDKESLTPILTAIGLELNRGIVAAERINNILVEGPSDYFYLTALKNILRINDVNFISGGSSGNMPKVGTILQGWGCKVVYLYDNDQAYRDAKSHIKEDWRVLTADVLAKLPVNGAIEDVFSKSDFAKYIADINVDEVKGKNSDYSKGKDKVLQARKFLDQVNKKEIVELEKETLENANKLFKLLKDTLVHAT